MRPEIEYEMWVKQPMAVVMDQVVEDAAVFSITEEEVARAVLNWALSRIKDGEVPDWFLNDMNSE